MKNLIFIFLLFTIFSIDVNAAVHRVNNTGADADFTNVQDAHDAASAGDSIYIEASPTSYGTLTISKKIHVFGTGYFLAQNMNLQASVISSKLYSISLAAGSDETTIQGLYFDYGILMVGNPSISDVIISRNAIVGGIYFTSTGLIEDIFILHNYIIGTNNPLFSLRTEGLSNKNLIVMNNIFAYAGIYSRISLHAQTSAVFLNNIFNLYVVSTSNCDYQNNIWLQAAAGNPTLNSFSYNVATATQVPAGSNNQQNVNNASIFVGYPTQGSYTSDNRFELLGGSPAEGAGNGGVDCGVFGGTQPYILSGIPPIPTIYKFDSPNVVTGNFNITVSTRSNN